MARVTIGIMARRSPDGNFLSGTPIVRDVNEKSTQTEYIPLDELSEIFADRFKIYKKKIHIGE